MRKSVYVLITLSLCLILMSYGCGDSGTRSIFGGPGTTGGGGGVIPPTSTPTPSAITVKSIVDANGGNTDPQPLASKIVFTINGFNFGNDQNIVNFVDVNTNIATPANVSGWSTSLITGDVTIPAGKYLVQVVSKIGNISTDQIFYFKGTGTFPVTVQ